MIFPASDARLAVTKPLYCFEPNSKDEDIRRLDCVFDRHCLGLAVELLGERLCLRRVSRREDNALASRDEVIG
jgi:hypothetical protein